MPSYTDRPCALASVALALALLLVPAACESRATRTVRGLAATASIAAGPAPAPRAASSADATRAATGTRLILLGTKGGPRVGAPGTARNASTLILIAGVPYVVDCGYGTSTELVGAGAALNSVRHVFITHHHSDHMLELGPLVYNGWVTGLRSRLDVHGPPGTADMITNFFAYMQLDIATRMADEGRPDPRELVVVSEFHEPGLVMQNDSVKVTAARVDHPPIEQAYAYRFDTKDVSIVISGDTTYAPRLAEFARGADVLVHEVMLVAGLDALLKRVPNATALRQHLLASHTVPEDVGKLAAAAGVKTLVLTHFVPGDDPSISDETWTAGVKQHFQGNVVVGKDLLEIPLGPARASAVTR
jgi:ribonuclease BN (tRNA processing enzyme)